MKRVFFYWPNDDACGHYRSVLPARHLTAPLVADGIQIVLNDLLEIAGPAWDAIVVGRIVPDDVQLWLLRQKALGAQIIWDLDDDLWNIPPWNDAVAHTGHSCLDRMPALVDHIWCSTEPLASAVRNRFPALAPRTRVLSNLVDPGEWDSPSPRASGPLRLLWAGSTTHRADIDLILEPLSSVLTSAQGAVQLLLCGDVHPELRRRHAQHLFPIAWMPLATWRATYAQIAPDIVLAPLVSHPFNAAKSALRYYEASLVGACTLASRGPAYADLWPGIDGFLCDTPTEWARALTAVIQDARLRADLATHARESVLADHSWSSGVSVAAWKRAVREAVAA